MGGTFVDIIQRIVADALGLGHQRPDLLGLLAQERTYDGDYPARSGLAERARAARSASPIAANAASIIATRSTSTR